MEKDMTRNIAIGFAIGFFFILFFFFASEMPIVWRISIAVVAGIIGASLGWVETIVQRKKKGK
jgi:hypothetical protein